MESADELVLPAIVIGELFSGFLQGNRTENNMAELKAFLKEPGVRVQDIGIPQAEKYGLLIKNLKAAGTPIPTNDVWIAATALSLGASILTRDRHFESVIGLFVQEY
jgi:tRNA(fMet)-specific endonuclease VapC